MVDFSKRAHPDIRIGWSAVLLCGLLSLTPMTATHAQNKKAEVHYDNENIPDEEKTWQEGETQLPAYPDLTATKSFFVSPTTVLDFSIDPASISVGKDEMIRYTLIVKSRSGAANLSFEGLRCATAEYKVYAYGNLHTSAWSAVRDPQWKEIHETGPNRPHAVLLKEYFCDQGALASKDPRQLLKRLSTRF